jgi:hypothetical protein
MMSIRTMFQPAAAHDLSVALNVVLGDDVFTGHRLLRPALVAVR